MCGNKISNYTIISSNGLLQGDPCSPVLSNIYQQDLSTIFDQSCDPIQLKEVEFNNLSWADDLMLISTSKTGLQESLNRLNRYCERWGLSVNLKKSKYMIFGNRDKKVIHELTYFKDIPMTKVDRYDYPGITFHCSGKFNLAMKERILKANRALYIIRQAFATSGCVSPSVVNSLFDAQVVSILLYGSVIWGSPNGTNFLYLNQVDEKYDLKRIKLLFGEMKILSCKRVGQKNIGRRRPILIEMEKYEDKIKLVSEGKLDSYTITDRDTDYDSMGFEKMHANFCRHVLQVHRSCNVHTARLELGRYPLAFRMWSACIKYFLRLAKGTDNSILNAAFEQTVDI